MQSETIQQGRTVLSCGDLESDVDARLVGISALEISVTYVEFEILHRMLRDQCRAFTRAQPLISGAGATIRSVDIHISRLRKKTSSARSFVIETVPHVGYRCRDYAIARSPPCGKYHSTSASAGDSSKLRFGGGLESSQLIVRSRFEFGGV